MQQYFETGCDGYCERLWYNNGGYFTHNAFKHCRKEYRKEILDYIASLPINIDIVVNGQQILLFSVFGDFDFSILDNYL